MKLIKNLFKLIIFIALLAVTWYVGSIAYYKMTFSDETANIVKEDVSAESLDEGNEIKANVDKELLFLLAGTDQNNKDSSGATRTDTLMLFKVNFANGTIDQLSIPRDTLVLVDGNYTKINHASAYGGIELTMKTIRDWLDIDLDYYVKVNFESVVSLVDFVGGVKVDVPENVAGAIGLKPGLQRLNGKQALDFVRFRKGYATGDFGRVEAQQKFMQEVIKQVFTPKNLLRSPILLNMFYKQVDTNIPKLSLARNMLSMMRLSERDEQKYIIPGEGAYIDGISYYVYYKDETTQLRDKLFDKYRLNQENYLENLDY